MPNTDQSPIIDAQDCLNRCELSEPTINADGSGVVFIQTDSSGARFVRVAVDGSERYEIDADPQPRPGRGLGGGCWCFNAAGTGLLYVAVDGNVWSVAFDGLPSVRLTNLAAGSAASGPASSSDGRLVVYVVDQSEVWVASAQVNQWTNSLEDRLPRRLDHGTADFVLDPAINPDGSEAMWMAWNIPNMPWDSSRIERASLTSVSTGNDQPRSAPDQHPDISIQQPRFSASGTVLAVCDRSGWLNISEEGHALLAEPIEHAGPTWGPGQRSYAVSPDGSGIAFTRNVVGFGRLCVLDVDSGVVRDLGRGVHGQVSWRGGFIAALRTGAVTPTQIVVYNVETGARTILASTSDGPTGRHQWLAGQLVEPYPVTLLAGGGATLHARVYPANEPARGLMCWIHGGPTDQWQVTHIPRIAYWRSRGWNVLVVDHRGSTGHGRGYQQAMRGQWGVLDVSDTIDFIEWAHLTGLGTMATTVIIGGSAGGFTALCSAATRPGLVAAVVASYPVCDIADLGERSHRFERHYNDTLVGPVSDQSAATAMHDRSPINLARQLAHTPILIMHGSADPVVPVEQSVRLADRIRFAGGSIDVHVYDGEGHGFRQRETQLDEYRRIGAFIDVHVPSQRFPTETGSATTV